MKLSRRHFGLGLAASAGASPAMAWTWGQRGSGDQSQALTTYLDAAFEQELAMDPERLTRLGRKGQQDRLTDPSDAAARRGLAWRRRSVRGMKARFDRTQLNPEAQTSYDIWILELERAEMAERWRRHRYLFDRNGPHTGLPNFLINSHRVDTVPDMEAYIARLGAIGPSLDEQLGQAQRSAAAGIRMPRFAYAQSLDETRRLMRGAPFAGDGEAPLYADAKAKVAGLVAKGAIDAGQGQALLAAVTAAMTEKMAPAYGRLAAWLESDRDMASVEPQGAGDLPDGLAFYAAMLRLQTTTDMTAAQIHTLGLSEVDRLHAEMEILKAKIGFAGSLADFFVFMRTSPQFTVSNDEAGRQQYLKLARDYLAGIKVDLPKYFGRLPEADLVVKRVEAFREEPGGAAHYARGAADGSRPGVFYVHLSDTKATPTYELEGTAYHEGLPGHHMQLSIAQELTDLPVFRTQYGYGAYLEGWGLYSEALAKEMGQYVDPYSDFGRLSRELWRAIRLVVDTGLHAQGWSEAKAYAYYSANSPQPEAKIRSEIRRYLTNPGQATSYKVGMVKINALRDQARARLGERFDYRGFHDMVLGGGALPLSVLEARVGRWIEARAASDGAA